jgi:hypothetical protein
MDRRPRSRRSEPESDLGICWPWNPFRKPGAHVADRHRLGTRGDLPVLARQRQEPLHGSYPDRVGTCTRVLSTGTFTHVSFPAVLPAAGVGGPPVLRKYYVSRPEPAPEDGLGSERQELVEYLYLRCRSLRCSFSSLSPWYCHAYSLYLSSSSSRTTTAPASTTTHARLRSSTSMRPVACLFTSSPLSA